MSLRERIAKVQYECGANFLDVNAGVASGNEEEDLPWLVQVVQKEISIPLMLDSANPKLSRQPSPSIVIRNPLFSIPFPERKQNGRSSIRS